MLLHPNNFDFELFRGRGRAGDAARGAPPPAASDKRVCPAVVQGPGSGDDDSERFSPAGKRRRR